VVSFTPRPLYSHGKSPWYPLDRRLGGPQSRSGRGGEEKNSQPLPGLETPIIQPIAQRYTTELSQQLSRLILRIKKFPLTEFVPKRSVICRVDVHIGKLVLLSKFMSGNGSHEGRAAGLTRSWAQESRSGEASGAQQILGLQGMELASRGVRFQNSRALLWRWSLQEMDVLLWRPSGVMEKYVMASHPFKYTTRPAWIGQSEAVATKLSAACL
jgi:hypothetical protein